MSYDDPLAYFITWTIYGTHLQGDNRGWRRWGKGNQEPRPNLVDWRAEKLKYPIQLLSTEQRLAVEEECRKHSEFRNWRVWAVNARSNHCHIVVTAENYDSKIVRDQLKANATRRLRDDWAIFRDRPAWTVGGDRQCINHEDDLETVCLYVRDAQDRKDRDV